MEKTVHTHADSLTRDMVSVQKSLQEQTDTGSGRPGVHIRATRIFWLMIGLLCMSVPAAVYAQTSPVANDDEFKVRNDGDSYIYVLLNDEEGDHPIDTGSIEIVSQPSHADDLVLESPGVLIYRLNAATTETADSFTYRVSDTEGNVSNEVTVEIDIIEAFDFTTDSSHNMYIGEGVTPQIDLTDFTIYPFGIDESTIELLETSDSEGAVINIENGILTYQHPSPLPDPEFFEFRYVYTVQSVDGTYSPPVTHWLTFSELVNVPFTVNAGVETELNVVEHFDNLTEDDLLGISDFRMDRQSITILQDPAKGTAVSNPEDAFLINYSANQDAGGGDEFTVQGLSDFSDLPVAIYKVQLDIAENTPPVLTSVIDEETVTEGEEFTLQFEAEDPDGDELTFALSEGGDVANASITAEGLFSFSPDGGQAGEYPFTVQVSDGVVADEHTFTVFVLEQGAPVVNDDEFNVRNGGDSYIYVTLNDQEGDFPIDLTSIELIDAPSHADELFLSSPGVLIYRLNAATAETSDSFTYRVSDTEGNVSNTATVTVNIVEASNFTTDNLFQFIGEGISPEFDLTRHVMYNGGIVPATIEFLEFSDPDGIQSLEEGTLFYEHPSPLPDPQNFALEFRYTVQSVDGTYSPPVLGSITFSELLNAPFTVEAGVETELNAVAHINELTDGELPGISDLRMDEQSITIVQDPAKGTAVADADDAFLIDYTADADASGSDEFTVQGLSDFSGLPAYLYRVQLDIQENGSPVFTSVTSEETLTEGEEFGFQFEAEDPDGDELTFTLTAGGDVANASLTAEGLFSFAPEAGQAGEYPFTVQVSDGVLTDEHEFTIEVEPPNQPPLFTTTFDEQTIREGEEFSFQFEAEDSNGDTLVFNLTEGEDVENVSFSEEGLFTFVPDFEQAGEYGFMVEVDDGELFTEHSFFIIVEEGNRPPEALSIMASTRINIPVTIDLTEYISDPDGDPLTIVNVSVPQYGQAFFDDNLVTYTPARNFSGTDDFQYTVSDGRGETAAGMVTIEVLGLSFKITELNLPDNVVSRAFDISDNGHVTGMINEGSGSAFLWVDEELSIISGLNQVFGVNDSGNLAGIAEEGGTALPAIYLNGNLVKGSTMGGDFAALYDINNSNTGVGVANDASGTLTGFLWNEKGQQPIAIDDGDLQLYSINNAGVMAGFLQVNNQQGQAVRVLPDGSIQLLSSGSGNSSRAFGAGNGGQIVGVIESGATIRGAVWQNGSVQELPGLGGSTTIAYDVNNSGVVVGSSGTASQKWISNRDIISQITGFVSDKNYKAKETTSSSFEFDNTASLVQNEGLRAALWLGNELTDLNDLIPSDSGWELIEARAINNHMNIVGFGLLNGEVRAFLLTPAEVEDPVAGISVQQVTGGKEAVVDLWRQVENTYGRATVTEIWGASHGAAELRQERYLHYTAGMDIVATADTVHYQVADQRGAVAEGEVVFVLGELSESFELSQNYPNPFNSSTVIPFKLAETGRVVVELYSINGRKIAVLMDQVLQRGTHRTELGNLNLSSGVYFYRLRVTNASGKPVFTETRKMSLVK